MAPGDGVSLRLKSDQLMLTSVFCLFVMIGPLSGSYFSTGVFWHLFWHLAHLIQVV